MRYLYKVDSADIKNMPIDDCGDIDLKVFTPSFRGIFLKGERTGFKVACMRILFQIQTLGRAQIYYVQSGSDIVHTSYVIPACAKFPFMNKNDLEIGPCYTHPAFRGKGIFPKVLSEICRRRNNTQTFYIFAHENNISSIKGIEKAGFVRCGLVCESKYLKQYKLVH